MSNVITLDDSAESVKHLCQKDKRLAKVISMIGSITYKPHEDSYRFLVETILGQMLSNKVTSIISRRLEELCSGSITALAINSLTDNQLKSIGISSSKVTYIRNLTTAVESGEIDFSSFPNMSDSEVIKKLTSIRGIGNWTAKMYLIFVMNRINVLPFEDVAFRQAFNWVYNTKKLVQLL
jgi:DNA-3-methyladenine glycosylase II